MVTSEADDTEVENTPFISGRAISTTSPEAAYTARVLLMLRLSLTIFHMVPISSLLRCAPGKQRDLLNTSPERYVQLFSKDVRVPKRDGRKALPKQACYPMRTS